MQDRAFERRLSLLPLIGSTAKLVGLIVALSLGVVISLPAAAKPYGPLISPLILIPDKAHAEGDVWEIGYGNGVFTGTVVQSAVALPEKASWDFKGLPVEVSPETPLRKATLPPGGPLNAFQGSLFCAETMPLPLKQRMDRVTKRFLFEKEVRVCLGDSESDGTFETAVLFGVVDQAELAFQPIAPIKYTTAANYPFKDRGKFAVVLYKRGAIGDSEMMPISDMMDGKLRITDVSIDETEKHYTTNRGTSVTPMVLPKKLIYGDGIVTILSVDKITKRVTVRLDHQISIIPIGFTFQTSANTYFGSNMTVSGGTYQEVF